MAIEETILKSLLPNNNGTVEYDEQIQKRLLESEEELKSGVELKDAFVFLDEMRAKYAAR